jgi:hypothetical protein
MVVISSSQTVGVNVWMTASVEFYSGTEIWVGQNGLPFASSTPTVENFKIKSIPLNI